MLVDKDVGGKIDAARCAKYRKAAARDPRRAQDAASDWAG
jgi:hypothetical protein